MLSKVLTMIGLKEDSETVYALLGVDQKIINEISKILPKAKIINSQQFIDEYINSILSNSFPDSKEGLYKEEQLIIKDFHLFLGKEAAQDELGRIIDSVLAKNGKILLLSRYSFNLISELDQPLRERLLHHSIWFNF